MNRQANTLPTLLATVTVAIACLGAAAAVHATSPDLSRIDHADLERLFWDCDAAATHEALTPGEGARCSQVADALKQQRFGGDFERMLDWWRARKTGEHAKRGAPHPALEGYDEAALQAP